MEHHGKPLPYSDYIREKHRWIYRRYLDLLRHERDANPLRAEHIGKIYYARVIADELSSPIDPLYVLRIINKMMRGKWQPK